MQKVIADISEKRNVKYTFVTDHWPEIIGPSMIRYARFERLDRLTLVIRCDNDSQKLVVIQQRNNIIKRFNRCYPESPIRYIRAIT